MKKSLFTIAITSVLITGSAFAANTNGYPDYPASSEYQRTYERQKTSIEKVNRANKEVESRMVAGSEARKSYCKRRRTHTQKDYFDCVKGYGGQHSQYSKGVIYPKNITDGGK